MIDVVAYSDQTVAVLGLGRSGLAAARALVRGGSDVWAWDDDDVARTAAQGAGLTLVDLEGCNWNQVAALVLSPGIPHTHPTPHPVAERARAVGCPIIGDIELLYRTQPGAAYIGITGTNGKSTTTALLGHVMEACGREVQVGGNLGTPVVNMQPLGEGGTYVLEMSSYQLELTDQAVFDVAALINITPDHLDRHGGMDGYVAAKRRIFQGQKAGHTAVIGIDEARSRAVYEELKGHSAARIVPVSAVGEAAGGVYVVDGILHDDLSDQAVQVLEMAAAETLPGVHNHHNAAIAYACARSAGLDPREIAKAMLRFPGLPHRQERVAELHGILFVNDSKATNAEAAARALDSYDAIYWIAGGLSKEGGLKGIEPHLGHVRHAFLIGEAEGEFLEHLRNKVPTELCGNLETAVARAYLTAIQEHLPGAVVLLSPAAASFDQFKNFEMRGEVFRILVEGL